MTVSFRGRSSLSGQRCLNKLPCWIFYFHILVHPSSLYLPVSPVMSHRQVRNWLNVTACEVRVEDLFPRRPGSHFSPAAHSQPVTKRAGEAVPKLQRAAAPEPLMSRNPIQRHRLEDFSDGFRQMEKLFSVRLKERVNTRVRFLSSYI